MMAEVGLDSRGNGEDAQAETLDWQIRACFSGGCAGMFCLLMDGRVVPGRQTTSRIGTSD